VERKIEKVLELRTILEGPGVKLRRLLRNDYEHTFDPFCFWIVSYLPSLKTTKLSFFRVSTEYNEGTN
jgi:hypothetical protein